MKIFKAPKKLSKCFICEWLYFVQSGKNSKTAKCAKNRLPPYISFPGKRLCTDFHRRVIMIDESDLPLLRNLQCASEPTERYSFSELFKSIPLRDI